MKPLLLITCLANLVMVAVTLAVGPAEMATHFGLGGEPDGWASATSNAALMVGLNLMLFAMFFASPILLERTPDRWINLPHREYWLADERRENTLGVLAQHLYAIGAATFLFMLTVAILTLQANLSDPVRLNELWVWVAVGLYLAYTLYWCAKLYLGFRLPKTT